MSKKHITVCLDENLHKIAKIQNINLSLLFNDYLETTVNYNYKDNNFKNDDLNEINYKINEFENIIKENSIKLEQLKKQKREIESQIHLKIKDDIEKITRFNQYLDATRNAKSHERITIGGKGNIGGEPL